MYTNEILSFFMSILFILLPIIVLIIAYFIGAKRNIFQAVAKVLMTLLAIIISVIITKNVVPSENDMYYIVSTLVSELPSLSADSLVISELLTMCSTLFQPLLFAGIFTLVSFVFLILYLIPKHLLSDKQIAAKKREKEVIVGCRGIDSIENPRKQNGMLKVTCGLLGVISAILVLAHIAVPVTYYSKLADEVFSIEITAEMADEIGPSTTMISQHPSVRIYRTINTPTTYFLDRVKSSNGEVGSASNALKSIFLFADNAAKIMDGELDANSLYSLADLMASNPYLDHLLASIGHEIVTQWEKGESWNGIEPIDSGASVLFKYVLQCDKMSSALRLLGDALSLYETLQTGEMNAETIRDIFLNLTPEGIEMLGAALEETLSSKTDTPTELADKTAGMLKEILNGVATIKNNDKISEKEKEQILEKEANVIFNLFAVADNPKDIDYDKLGKDLAESSVIPEAIQSITDNGQVKDPWGIADAIPSDATSSIKDGLQKGGISESSDLYRSMMSFFGE